MSLALSLRDRADIAFDLVLNAEPSEFRTFCSRNAVAENVTVHPRTSDPTIYYACSDLVLNLSRVDQWIETFGLTLAEAMSFGIPVIAPSVGGPTELISHGVEGYCIDSRDGAALRDAVLALADDPENYAAKSRAALARARDFSFDAYVVALRDALDTLVQKDAN